jgi:hypothetical protein
LVDYRKSTWERTSWYDSCGCDFVTDSKCRDFGSLETGYFRETRSRHELEQAALDHFKETIMVNEGRYEVCLPWLEGHERLQENMNLDIVKARCVSTATKLLVEGRYSDYDAVFEEWLRDVIQVVPESELKNKACYLPHRGVFKDNSTTKLIPVFDASFKT